MKDKDPRDDLFDALTVSLHDRRKGSRKGGGTRVQLVPCPQCVLWSDPEAEAPFPALSPGG